MTGWFGRGRTRALLSAGLLVGVGAVTTSAYWRDQGSVPGVSFSTGALHIDLAANVRVKPETYTWSSFPLNAIVPGTSRSATLPVTNNSAGAASFSYRVQMAATDVGGGNLAAALQVTVRRGGTSDGTTCSGGTLVGSANATLDGFDQPAGATLAPTQAHSMCVEVGLPSGASVTSGAQASLTLTFPATQVP